jgi:hypothetical protein
MAVGRNVKAVRLADFDTAGLTGLWDLATPTGLDHACTALHITNGSNVDLEISFDGVNAHDVVLADKDYWHNCQANAVLPDNDAQWRRGQKVWVKWKVPGVGSVYIAGFYQ